MKKFTMILNLLILGFLIIGCDSDSGSKEQEYDMMEYIVNSTNWAKIQTQMETYGDGEPTKTDFDNLEKWIILNASPQVYPMRNLTRKEITDMFLDYTTFSRDQINTLFNNVNSIGKSIAILSLQDGNWSIIFISKI